MAQNPSNVIPDQLIVVEGDAGFVPKAEPSDSGKVLGVLNSDGDIGWTEGASSSDIFVAKYGVTTYSEIAAAIADGKDVVCMYVDSNNVTYTYTMTAHNADNQFVRFAWLKRNNNHTISSQCDDWYEILLQGTTWRDVAGPYPANVSFQADGSTTEATKDQNIVQFSVKNPLPASTSSDADKVLTVNSSGAPEWATAQGGGGSEVGGPYVVNADPEFTSVTSLSAYTTVGYYNIYYELVDSTETRQVAAVRIPSMTFNFTSFADRVAIAQKFSNASMTVSLKKVNTATNTVSSVSGVSVYTQYANNISGGYQIKFSELLFIPSSGPLPVLGENEKYVIVIGSLLGSSPYIYPSRAPSNATAQVYFYSASEKVVFNPRSVPAVRDPLFASSDFIMLKTDPDKGMVVGDNFQYNKGLLTLNNTRHAFDYDNYTENPNPDADRVDIVIPLQDDWYNDSGYQKRFPAARMFKKFGGPNHGTYDTLFENLTVGDVYVVHIEAPATSTASGDHVAFCYFTLCETVEDWEAGTSTQYYHNFVLPGIYRSSMGGKFMADGTITISGSHSNGTFSGQIYSGPDIVALESGVTITPSYGVDGWNFCVSKI